MTTHDEPRIYDLGHDHFVWFTSWSPDRELNPQYKDIPDIPKYGLVVKHLNKETGKECVGGVTFDLPDVRKLHEMNPAGGWHRARWQVIDLNPETLHIEPSLLCSCGDHGWIRNGRWEPIG